MMTEVQLYNMQNVARAGLDSAKDTRQAMLAIMIRHLRYDHEMSIRDIAKRCNIKMKAVQEFLGDE
jgi:DNA-binding transcriptional regulator YiaG